jgi:acetyltransferase-like isoleucine patch superfamily enzyme
MIFMINFANKLRNKIIYKKLSLIFMALRDKKRSLIGLVRSFSCIFLGRIEYNKNYRPLIIGSKVHFDFWSNASIILLSDNGETIIDACDRTFPTASSIGTFPPYDHMNPTIWSATRIRLRDNAKLILEPNNSILKGCYIAVAPNKTLKIGRETQINSGVIINTLCGMEIGKNVLIAFGAMLMDYDGHPVFYSEDDSNKKDTYAGNSKEIKIEDNVWIGAKAMILKGVTVGANSIVAANSCVTNNVPRNSIVGGNPAKIIKENISWRRY